MRIDKIEREVKNIREENQNTKGDIDASIRNALLAATLTLLHGWNTLLLTQRALTVSYILHF
jgi:hypothetical protein